MKKLAVFCLLLIISFGSFAQNDPGWTLLNQKSGVKLYVKYATCDQQSIVYLKATNSTGKQVVITWKEHFKLNDQRVEVNSGQAKSFSLDAGKTAVGNCVNDQNISLITNPDDYVSMAGPGFWELEIYELEVQ